MIKTRFSILALTAGLTITAFSTQTSLAFDSPAESSADAAYSSADAMQTRTAVPSPETVFILEQSDILAWEESGKGKYIYLDITEEKNEELAKITTDHLGEPLKLQLGDNFIFIPQITSTINQKNGFVLQAGDGQRQELKLMMLDISKHREAQTEIETDHIDMEAPVEAKPAAIASDAPAPIKPSEEETKDKEE